MLTKKPIRVLLPLVILLLMICATTKGGATRSRKPSGTVLTGKFVAQIDGPPLTGFGLNQQSYVFEILSPFGSQFVRISDTFLIYQSHVPGRILDYSKVYKLPAVRNQKCDETLEDISRRFLFDFAWAVRGNEVCPNLREEPSFSHCAMAEPFAMLYRVYGAASSTSSD